MTPFGWTVVVVIAFLLVGAIWLAQRDTNSDMLEQSVRDFVEHLPDNLVNAHIVMQGKYRFVPEVVMAQEGTQEVLMAIARERAHQRNLGWTEEHDDEHNEDFALVKGAMNILRDAFYRDPEWPNMAEDWYGFYKDYTYERHILVAAALLVAELERLQRED